MKKIKIEFSFILLILLCIIFNKITYLFNYILALILHELAHLFVATKKGYNLKVFKLKMSGLVIELDNNIDDKDSFLINLAGPLFNILLAVCCMALYWIIPTSYQYLHVFCNTNIILALFNLLPLQPLDGGKIFSRLFKQEKTFKRIDLVLRIGLALLFMAVFILSLFDKPNLFFILFALFFIINKNKKSPTFSLFKYKKGEIEKVKIYKIDNQQSIFNLIKLIKKSHYAIFYCVDLKNRYLDEDEVIDLALKYPLTSKIGEIVNLIN